VAAQATLFINEKLSVPAESGWVNPYHTNEKTRGYFSFWPQAEMGDSDSLSVELRIGFDHSEYRPFSFHKRLKVQGEFFVHDYIRSDRLLDVGTLALERA
jgi:hypothetical protein